MGNRGRMTPYLVNGGMGIHVSTVTLNSSKTGLIPGDSSQTYEGFIANANAQNGASIGISTELFGLFIESTEFMDFHLSLVYLTVKENNKQILTPEYFVRKNGKFQIEEGDPQEFKFKYHYNFLQIPLRVDFNLIDNVYWDFGASIGGAVNVRLNSRITENFDNSQIYHLNTYNKLVEADEKLFVIDGSLSLWARYNINSSLGAFGRLYFNNGVTPMAVYHDYIKQYSLYSGVELGIRMRILKNF